MNRRKAWVGGSLAHGRFPLGHVVVQLRPAFGTSSVANTTVGTTNLFGHEFVVPPHCSTRRWTMHENQPCGCLRLLGLEVVPRDGEGRVIVHTEDKEARVFLFRTTSSGQHVRKRVNHPTRVLLTKYWTRHLSIERATRHIFSSCVECASDDGGYTAARDCMRWAFALPSSLPPPSPPPPTPALSFSSESAWQAFGPCMMN